MKKKLQFTLGIIQSFVAVMALPSGLSMLIDPSGESLGISLDYLKTSPFSDFFIPALFLFIGNGLGHLTGAILTFRKNKSARIIGIGLGFFLLIWIIVQLYYIGIVHFLQPLFLVVAIVEIVLAVLAFTKLTKDHC